MNEKQMVLGRKAAELSILSEELSNEDKHEESLAAMQEATDAWRELSEQTGAFKRELAGALTNLAGTFLAVDRLDEGLVHARESVEMYRTLADENHEHQPELAAALNNFSAFLGQAGDAEGSLDISKESVFIYQTLADTDPEQHLPSLSQAKANLAFAHQDLEQHAEAAQAAKEGVAALAPLFMEHGLPLAHLMDALVGLYVEMCDGASVQPDDAMLLPLEEKLEELDEGEIDEHECGPGCDHEHVH